MPYNLSTLSNLIIYFYYRSIKSIEFRAVVSYSTMSEWLLLFDLRWSTSTHRNQSPPYWKIRSSTQLWGETHSNRTMFMLTYFIHHASLTLLWDVDHGSYTVCDQLHKKIYLFPAMIIFLRCYNYWINQEVMNMTHIRTNFLCSPFES